jgi:D-alanine--poly(phosphoribitol) ligase subunit 2
MHTEAIRSELRKFVRQQFSIPENDPDFSDDIDLFNYGYIDSIGAVELTAFVEKHFGIRFSDSDWVNSPLNSIGEISFFIGKRLEGQSNHA